MSHGRRRPSALAGTWYPSDAVELARTVDALVADVTVSPSAEPAAIISPHAGYRYSGPTAAVAWAALCGRRPRRVVLMGPAHRVAFRGVSVGDFESYRCPLGDIPVDRAGVSEIHRHTSATTILSAHQQEHCIEIMLPFLARTCGPVTPILPLLVGQATRDQVLDILERAVGPEDVLVISTDLSHFLPYAEARQRDLMTLDLLGQWPPPSTVGPENACGYRGLLAGLELAQRREWSLEVLDYRNSGDTAGTRERVVGYAAAALVPATVL